MQYLNSPLLILHLIGFAVLLGTVLFYRKSNNRIALWAGGVQLITGILLLLTIDPINGPKVATKLGVLFLIVVLLVLWRKKDWTVSQRWILGLLVLTNVCLAVVW